jgi:lipid II:glycine glycyltransferase (peptidoglycan interpeptide bridge formation enzyme)
MRIYSSTEDGFCSPEEWDRFSQLPQSGHLLQSWAWGELKARFGWYPVRIAAVEGNEILAAAQILLRSLPAGLRTAYVPRGPLIDPVARDTATVAALLHALHDACRRQHSISLKIEPDWPETPDAQRWLETQGFVASAETVQPRRTVIVDLTASEDEILAQMKSKTRYNIRLSQRKGVVVRQGTADDLPVFHQLLQVTSRRAGFGVHTLAYYRQAWQLFTAKQAVALFLATHENKTLAAIMVFVWGKTAYYMYGGSSDEERQRMPTYLSQWEAMRWAKARGCECYDLWGIADVDEHDVGPDVATAEETGVLSTGLGGLYRFKRGFGGREVRYVGAYDYAYNRPLHALLAAAWKWRKR